MTAPLQKGIDLARNFRSGFLGGFNWIGTEGKHPGKSDKIFPSKGKVRGKKRFRVCTLSSWRHCLEGSCRRIVRHLKNKTTWRTTGRVTSKVIQMTPQLPFDQMKRIPLELKERMFGSPQVPCCAEGTDTAFYILSKDRMSELMEAMQERASNQLPRYSADSIRWRDSAFTRPLFRAKKLPPKSLRKYQRRVDEKIDALLNPRK